MTALGPKATEALTELVDRLGELSNDSSDTEWAARLACWRELFAEQLELAAAGVAYVEGTVVTLDN